jgi:hypothetical protein
MKTQLCPEAALRLDADTGLDNKVLGKVGTNSYSPRQFNHLKSSAENVTYTHQVFISSSVY